MHCVSLRCCRYLRDKLYFPLPRIITLRTWARAFQTPPGLIDCSLKIRRVRDTFLNIERFVVLPVEGRGTRILIWLRLPRARVLFMCCRALIGRGPLRTEATRDLRSGRLALPPPALRTRPGAAVLLYACCSAAGIHLYLYKALGIHTRNSALSFHEMTVDHRLSYDSTEDRVYGPCKQVQVLMVRSRCSHWKQPVYFDTSMTRDIMFSAIAAVKDAGFQVVAMVCDLSPTSRGFLYSDRGLNMKP